MELSGSAYGDIWYLCGGRGDRLGQRPPALAPNTLSGAVVLSGLDVENSFLLGVLVVVLKQVLKKVCVASTARFARRSTGYRCRE